MQRDMEGHKYVIQNAETIQSYFTRVSQIKEQLEVVDEEVENAKIVMKNLNGLPRSWDSFIQGIVPERTLSISADCGKTSLKKKLE